MKTMGIGLFQPDRLARRARRQGMAILACAPLAGTVAQPPSYQQPPKLIVGIVVDQMRTDYIYRYWDNFGQGGFKRLCTGGAFLRDAHFDYTPTETGPGHASVYTGTTPARHGIVANEMRLRATGATNYCASAHDSIRGVGMPDDIGRRSPRNLLATTLADELERRFDGKARTIGIALKDRGAILPIGRTGDAAFWFAGGPDGAFGTSTWYMRELPEWLQRFNGERLASSYLGRTWDPLLPRERYHQALPDENPFEIPISGAASATLPLDLKALLKASGSTSVIAQTPWGNTLATDLALAAIEGEGLGADDITDLLAISYSSPDLLGHRMGPRALEIEDMYLRLDLELARLLDELDARVGPGRYTVFLTADHAAVDVPSYLASLRGSAGYPDVKALEGALNAALAKRFGPGRWVRALANEQVFLKVTVAEVKRSALKQFGVDLNLRLNTGGLITNVISNPQFGLGLPIPPALFGGGVPGVTNVTDGMGAVWTDGSTTIGANVRALEQQGVLRVLAEPTLSAISGETADFLAGGEFPVPVGNSCDPSTNLCQLQVEFKPYGVALAFTPVVMSGGRISLKVKTEVSE
ncbi:MAG: alkaline phosphatase family protein, partial [Flavobacteriales bacterium]